MSDVDTGVDAPATPSAIEKEARALGWSPLDQWRGPEEKWVDAETFVERGHQVMPILKKNNEVLLGKLSAAETAANAARSEAAELRTSIADILKFQKDEVKRQVDAEVTKLRADLKAARIAGDAEAEANLGEALDMARDRQREIAAAPPPPAKPPAASPAPQVDPEIKAWTEENTWFGPKGDKRKTALVVAIAEEINEKTGMRGRALLEAAATEAEKTLGGTATSKTEGARGGPSSGSGGGSSGTSFSSLPAEAKAQAIADEKKFVGPNKAFKTVAEWHKHYANVYFNG